MSWLKIDDKLPRNSKILEAGLEASWFYICALTHCAESLTDGYIAESALPILAPHISDPRVVAERCIQVGLMCRVDTGGYLIPDYTDFNPSREKVLAEREAGRRRANESRAGRSTERPAERAGERAPNVRRTNGRSSPDPSRPVQDLSLVSPEVTTTSAPENDDERFANVITAIVTHQLDNRNRRPGLAPIDNEPSWRRSAATKARREHTTRISELLANHTPDTPAALIAASVLGERASTLDHYRIDHTCHGDALAELPQETTT